MTQPLQTGAFPVTGCLIKAAPLLRQDRSHGRPGEADGEGRQLLRETRAPSRPPGGGSPASKAPGGSEPASPPSPGGGLRFDGRPAERRPGKGSVCKLGAGPSIHSFIHQFIPSVSQCLWTTGPQRPWKPDSGFESYPALRLTGCELSG